MEKVSVRWACESCHHELVTVAWRTSDPEEFEPVKVRARCVVCGNTSERSFRPGTDPNTDETYTIEEWTKRGETERATRHVLEGEQGENLAGTAEVPAGAVDDDDLEQFATKAEQCQPPHIASTWSLVPPVNEWYAADVPRLLEEVRRLRADNLRLQGEQAGRKAGRERPAKSRA
ncbi:MAG TPA: hypothetical protein VII13_21940 [Vicinamibacteria bacterium]|jgi:hypothetical protein